MTVRITIEGREKLLVVGDLCLSRRAVIDQVVQNEMKQFGQRLVTTAKKDYLSGPRPDKLDVVTGRLRNSITALVQETAPHEFELSFGSNVVYARIHELGGPVTRNGKTIFEMKKRPFLRTSWQDEYPGEYDRLQNLLMEVCGRLTPDGE